MFGITRSNPFDEMMAFHRGFDRLFNEIWNQLPSATWQSHAAGFDVCTVNDAWKVHIPLPGIDPRDVTLEVAGNSLRISAAAPASADRSARFDQVITVPTTVDLDKVTASYRYGLLELTLPWKDSVKPRRIEIETSGAEQKALHAVVS